MDCKKNQRGCHVSARDNCSCVSRGDSVDVRDELKKRNQFADIFFDSNAAKVTYMCFHGYVTNNLTMLRVVISPPYSGMDADFFMLLKIIHQEADVIQEKIALHLYSLKPPAGNIPL